MRKQGGNNLKLGIFVLSGILFLVLLLYMIGKNRSLFGSSYELNARFDNVQGLLNGNNVRYSGIQAGTVSKIQILNDTTIEVTMSIDQKMGSIIKKNARVSIGTDGLVGNKVVNIVPGNKTSELAVEGDILFSKKGLDTDEILQTLNQTNNDVAVIAANLKTTVQRINSSNGLWDLLNDGSIPQNIKLSIANIRLATNNAGALVNNLNNIVKDVKKGKGAVGNILTDTTMVVSLKKAIENIKKVGADADLLVAEINSGVIGIKKDVNTGKGPANALMKDSIMVERLNSSLENIQKGTDGFNQNMEALKDNFLFRRHYRKLEKQKKKEETKSVE